jgi:succinate dehydrogenase/fumarate reductase flavoprotein subunit
VVGLHSSIRLAGALLTVIKERRESRGPHYRQDCPEPQDAFQCRLQVSQETEGFSCRHMPVTTADGKAR